MSDSANDTNAQNPEGLHALKLTKPLAKAAGIPAVVIGVKHMLAEMRLGRALKASLKLNQKTGFDCPGCAWPDPDDERSRIGEYCENGLKAIAEEATTKKLLPDFFAQHDIHSLSCLTDYEIGKKGRIAQPMYLPQGATNYQPISWDDAFNKIASHLNALSSPDEAIFYTSGRTSNEAAFLYQLFVREYGTNNLPDCSNMCHESSGVALTESLGIGKGSVKLEDFYETEVIIILGQNPGTNHPRMLTALQKAKDNGAIIISINPLPEAGLMGFNNPQTFRGILGLRPTIADLHLPIKINGDMALLQAIELVWLQEEKKFPGTILDNAFIQEHTENFEAFAAHLRNNKLEILADACGISIKQIREAAMLIKEKKKIIACWAMGLTQHKNAVDTIKEIVNLLLLKGSIGKPGGGTCPVRGHSNVQGDRTMGIYEKPADTFLDQLQSVYKFQPPRHHGFDTVDAIHAMYNRKAKVFFALGGNFLSATPDTNYTAEALRNCLLTVHVSTKLNRSHLVHGKEALILPCLARSDNDEINGETQFVSCENSMGVVQLSKGNLQPVSTNLLSEPAIVCRLAKATLGKRSVVPWGKYEEHYDHIRTDIEKVIKGFEQYNERVRQPGGFYLPNANRDGQFNTFNGRAAFNIATASKQKLNEGELMMMTIRSHDQFNTTIYGLNDRYRGIKNERRVIFMNEKDMQRIGLQSQDVVDIYNFDGGVERIARQFIAVPFPIPESCTATYFPETNVLVPISNTADKSNTPVSKLVVVQVRKV